MAKSMSLSGKDKQVHITRKEVNSLPQYY